MLSFRTSSEEEPGLPFFRQCYRYHEAEVARSRRLLQDLMDAVLMSKVFSPVKSILRPRIFSTLQGNIKLPSTLEEAAGDRTESIGEQTQTSCNQQQNSCNQNSCQAPTNRYQADRSLNRYSSELHKVNISELVHALRDVEKVSSTDDILCAFEIPKGKTNLVTLHRKFGEDYYKVFLCSELSFLKFLGKSHHDKSTYILCCNGMMKKSMVISMLVTVSDDTGAIGYPFEEVTLVYPTSASTMMKDIIPERGREQDIGKNLRCLEVNRANLERMFPAAGGDSRISWKPAPPVALFRSHEAYKILWYKGGRTLIKKEHKIRFTGTGVKVRRQSFVMWLSLSVGIAVTIAYVVARSNSTNVEDLIQTALAIGALYAATILPLTYYMFYEGENLLDVVTGRVHLDTRKEFEDLSDEERLYIFLESLKLPESDRAFIDSHNTSCATGTVAGAAMRVNYKPSIGNLLAVGFKYWEDGGYDCTARQGLISPTRKVFDLKEKDGEEGHNVMQAVEPNVAANELLDYERTILRLVQVTDMKPCPIRHKYVGL